MTDDAKAQWLLERRTMLTGTDAAQVLALGADRAVAGELGHFGGPMAVYLEKIGEALPFPVTEAMRAGNRLQRPILEMYAERDEAEPVPMQYEPPYTVRRSPTVPHIGASLDALRTDIGAPVDAKNLRRLAPELWGEPGTDEMPAYYATQLVMQMHVTGAPVADLAVLVGGQELRVYRLTRDLALEADILDRLADFWARYVQPRTPPPVDGSPAWSEHLKRAFQKASELVVPADHATAEYAVALAGVKREIKRLGEDAAVFENQLKAAIGENRGVQGPGFKALWSPVAEQRGTNWETVALAVARELADLRRFTDPAVDHGMTAEELLACYVPFHQSVTRKSYRRFILNVQE